MKIRVVNKENLFKIIILLGLFLPAIIQELVDLGQYKQIIIGSIVNTCLFLCGIYEKDTKKIIAISTLPSVSVMLSGLLFSGLTFYSKLMIPFIWLGNLVIIYLSRLFYKQNKFISYSFFSIILKVFIIYGGFKAVSMMFNFPKSVVNVMGNTMGIIQLFTASIGFLITIFIIKKSKN